MALVPEGLSVGGGFDGIGQIILYGGIAILAALVLFAVAFLVKRMLEYKISVHIFSSATEGVLFQTDKAKYLRNKKTKRPQGIRLKRNKIIEQAPHTDYMSFDNKGKPHLFASIHDNKLIFFKPTKFMPEEGEVKSTWLQSDLHETLHLHKEAEDEFSLLGFWDKYGITVMNGLLTMVILIFMIVVFQQMDKVADSFTEGLGGVVNRLEALNAGGSP